eukprot:TRINITY_DN92048_c0_g1_i1.p1 TRINITY_DN92048_c0_g1~~TRINITY_DN92048_c0_g1_i1.p1  ORF type:complete len:299 (-),score=42.12 TRINITY_DN92048_c0_g1_i1:95-991(-)
MPSLWIADAAASGEERAAGAHRHPSPKVMLLVALCSCCCCLLVSGVGAILVYSYVFREDCNMVLSDTSKAVEASIPAIARARIGVFIAYGQSNSANYHVWRSIRAGSASKSALVLQYFEDKTYILPEGSAILGAGGSGSAVWGHVGSNFSSLSDSFSNSNYDYVVFGAAGWGGMSIAALSDPDNCHFPRLLKTYLGMLAKFGKVDAILYHQGESDLGNAGSYVATFRNMNAMLKAALPSDAAEPKWVVSLASYCFGNSDESVLRAQAAISESMPNVCRGPATDSLIGSTCGEDKKAEC